MEEKIKNDWQNTRFNARENADIMHDIINGRRRSALDSLSRRYRIFSIIGYTMAVVSVQWYFSPLFGVLASAVASVLVSLFLICGVLDDWFCRGVKSIDVTTMPIAEVAAKALYYRKRHLQAVAVLLPIGLAVIGFMAYASTWETSLLIGMAAGLLLGLVIGFRHLLRFMADYRNLSD